MSGSPAAFAAIFAALYAAHQVGDHWVQTHHQAMTKGTAGWVGRVACAQHVASLTAVKAAAVGAVVVVFGLQVSVLAVAAGLAVDAATHYWADRRTTLARLAELTGKGEFYRLGSPRPGRDDPPTLGTGAYALDQSWHIGWLFAAALIAALGTA